MCITLPRDALEHTRVFVYDVDDMLYIEKHMYGAMRTYLKCHHFF